MKSFRTDAKIEYRTIPLEFVNDSTKRYLQFRICPSELNWWQKTFQNKWMNVFKSLEYFEGYNHLFEVEETKNIISKCKTWREIVDFLNHQYCKGITKDREKALKEANDNLMWKSIK